MPELNVAGQNIVCARPSAGYPIANKPVMPKDTARLENLRMIFRMPRPRLKAGNDYIILATFGCIITTVRKNQVTLKKVRRADRLPLHPAAIGAVVGVTKQPKPLM